MICADKRQGRDYEQQKGHNLAKAPFVLLLLRSNAFN